MTVIIVGAGVTGVELARRLIAKKHTVVLIEQNKDTARHAANRLDCTVTEASGNDPKVLIEAHIQKADALVAVTDSDELNMIICGIAESLAPQVLKIARVRNENYVASLNTAKEGTLGINFLVHPDQEAALAIIHAVEHGAVSDIIAFENSPYQLTCFTIGTDSKLDGMSLQNIRSIITIPFVIVSIENQGKTAIPSGETVLSSGMRISVLTLPQHIEEFYTLAGFTLTPLKKIALVGIGKVGKRVAERLLEKRHFSGLKKFFGWGAKPRWEVAIIDKDSALAKQAAGTYPDARIYSGDVTDDAFIEEIALNSFDLVITATQNYELNMITSVYLKSLGIPKTVALVQSAILSNVAYKIGVDVAIPLKDVTVDTIMSHLGGKHLTRIHTMGAGDLEIIEITLSGDSEAADKSLKDIAMHGIFLILLVTNEQGCCIPGGNTILAENDKLAVIVQSTQSDAIIKYFTGTK
ncbi:MAG: Trk system potassium transporter TrkA [Treponema sp.]